MSKSKGKPSRKKGQAEEVVQCPHLHFKTDIIDRNVLSKEQHLNLLSTPKGYRWEENKKEGGDGGPAEELTPTRRILCSGRRMKKAEKVYVHNFLAEVWNLLTPEMIDRLKGMLMNEFGMSPQEANKFLRDQEKLAASSKPKSKQTLMKENQCDAATPMIIKNYLRKSFADIMANELEERIIVAICGPRSKQKVDVAQRLLKLLIDVTGEKCTLQAPKTGTQRILVFLADQMAVWMIDAVDAADKTVVDRKEKALMGIEDGGKGDGKDDDDDQDDQQDDKDVQIIHRKKRPSKQSGKSEGAGDGAPDQSKKQPSKKPTAAESGKKSRGSKDESKARGSKDESKAKAQSRSDDKKRRQSTEGAGGKSARGSKDRPQRKEGSRPDAGEKKPTSQGAKASDERRAQSKRSSSEKDKPASRADEGPKKSSSKPGTRASTSKTDVPPSRKPSQTATKADGGKAVGQSRSSRQLSSSGSRPAVTDSQRGSKQEQRPRTASEIQREKINNMISEHISGMIKEGSNRQTARSEALKDVISKKLEASNMPLDQKQLDAIKEASVLLAAYIDKQAETFELEYGAAPPPNPIAQRGKGPVFSVKQAASSFDVKQITHSDAATKVAQARGRPAPGTITLSKGGFNPKETKEWAKWANDVVSMADKWSKWIDSTVAKAVSAAEKKKAGQEVPDWKDWKQTAGEEALEWRRNKKLLSQSAALFQDKASKLQTGPSSAPSPGARVAVKNK